MSPPFDGTEPLRPRLPILTTSAQKSFSCPRRYENRYVKCKRPAGPLEAPLHFGRVWHECVEQWWLHKGNDRAKAALKKLMSHEGQVDPFVYVHIEELLRGYHYRWSQVADRMEVQSTEQNFLVPLRNPLTGAASRTFEFAGAMDVLVLRDGELWIMEHKTTSDSIALVDNYWQALRLDVQVSNYFNACKEADLPVRGVIYDVVKKCTIKPAKATPVEKRKLTKQGHLYANQRAEDETPEEYRMRVREAIAEDPNKYFRQGDVVRLESEAKEAAVDLWLMAQTIREARNLGTFPRNTARCFDWHRPCGYFDACTGAASLDDPERYEDAPAHQELNIERNEDSDDDSNESETERGWAPIPYSDDSGSGTEG